MSNERRILAAALQRDAFEFIKRDLTADDLTPQATQLLDHLAHMYHRSDALKAVDRDSLEEYLAVVVDNPKHVADFVSLVDSLPLDEVEPMAVAVLVNEQRAKSLRLQIAERLQTGQEYSEQLAELHRVEAPLRGEDEELLDLTDPEVFMDDLRSTSIANRMKLWPPQLHKRTDGAAPGHHIVLFGRPGIGKTLVTVNAVAGHLHDNYRVTYFGNEDPITAIRRRIFVRLARTNYDRFEADPLSFHDELVNQGVGGLNAFRLTPGTPYEIEELIRRTSPDVIVIDQLRNINTGGSGGASNADRIDAAAQEMRNVLGKHNIVGYSIAQAGAGEYGKNDNVAFLGKADIDNSKTGLPGACDLLVGVGCTLDMVDNHTRGLSLIKNKLKGGCEGDQFFIHVTEDENRAE